MQVSKNLSLMANIEVSVEMVEMYKIDYSLAWKLEKWKQTIQQ